MGPSSIFSLDNPRLMTAWMASHECLCSTHSRGASLTLQAAKTKALFWGFRLGCVFMLQLYIASDQTQGVEQVGNAKSACGEAELCHEGCHLMFLAYLHSFYYLKKQSWQHISVCAAAWKWETGWATNRISISGH